ncbi:MAG TPA: alpha/beta hydrolase [Methylovorus sp.]|jgi:arylformamidase|nr:alpha/beta hydrolase [Methylovorus sp.]
MRLPVLVFSSLLIVSHMAHAGPLRDLINQRADARSSEMEEEDAADTSAALPAGVKMLADIAYGSDKLQKMDVYLPPPSGQARMAPAPIIMMVHGGAWRIGDKSHSKVITNKLARWVPKGIILVSLNYRMLPGTAPLAQAEDAALALSVIQQKAPGWKGDASQLILMGHSAGAHLVSLLSSQPSIATAFGAKPWLATISLDSAALDVPTIMQRRHPRFYDQAFGKDSNYWRASSPWQQLTQQSLPLLAVCSTQRRDNPCEQAYSYQRRARELGVRVDVLEENLNHGEINGQLGLENTYTRQVEKFIAEQSAGLYEKLGSKP